MSRKCLAIGVGTVEPVDGAADEFPYLDGAVVAAETMGQWAINSGFAATDVVVLTDKGTNRVTDADLSNAFDTLLPAGTLTDHFILAFAGHGLTGFNDDTTYWLLSDSLDQGYSIFVEDLRRQLYSYGIQHLTIFSDACRAIANSRDLRGLLPRPGARKRHQPPLPDFEVARFNACQDATSAFMVRAPGSAAPGKCIFSGVLAEVLWGHIPEAFDGKIIDSASLGRGLRGATKERAAQYNLALVPGGSAFFDKVIYFDRDAPPVPPNPDLPPWPPAVGAQTAGAGAPAPVDEQTVPGIFKSVLKDLAVRTAVLGANFGESHIGINTAVAFPGLPDIAKTLVESVAEARTRLSTRKLSKAQKNAVSTEIADQLKSLEALAAGEARKKRADDVATSLTRAVEKSQDSNAPLVVDGAVKQIWSYGPITRLTGSATQNQFLLDQMGNQLLMLEFEDGLFAPIWSYPSLACTVLREPAGVSAISYRYAYDHDVANTKVAVSAISRLVAGNLSAAEVNSLATDLRYQKHVNPVFGAIAAYCYDVTGDLNSITRMAAYYGMTGQAAPYDVIFLGMIKNDGYMADVPAVAKDKRPLNADLPHWLTSSTPEIGVRIGGRCPWLRQGWDFIAAPEDAELPLVDGLMAYRPHLTSSIFTTFDQEGGQGLVQKWGLQPCLQD